MSWQITEQGAIFAISIIAFAYSGYQRGWRRELVSLITMVIGFVFILMGGGVYLAKLLYQLLLGVNLSTSALIDSHQRFVYVVTVIAVAIIILIGYGFARRRFPKAASLGGLLLGIITGAIVAVYLTHYLFPSTQTTTISAGTVNTDLIPNLTADFTVVVIFLAALVAIVIGLVAVRPKKGGGGGGGGGHK
jgi:hypothetical protein